MVQSAAFSHDGNALVIGGCKDGISVWDTKSLKPLTTIALGKEPYPVDIQFIEISSDNQYLLAGSAYQTVMLRIWQLATGKQVREFHYEGMTGVLEGYFVNESRSLIVATADSIDTWAVQTGQLQSQWKSPKGDGQLVTNGASLV